MLVLSEVFEHNRSEETAEVLYKVAYSLNVYVTSERHSQSVDANTLQQLPATISEMAAKAVTYCHPGECSDVRAVP